MNPFLREVGQLVLLSMAAFRVGLRRPFEARLLLEQMYRLGVRSLPLVALTTIFTGAVMALQVSFTLSAYGAQAYVGSFVGASMVKELGPVLTAVMLAARVGAGITAELGSMAVTEQIDAIRALGADPIKKLVVPRLFSLLLMVPVLTMLSVALGILGGMYVGVIEIGQTPDYYWSKVLEYMKVGDVVSAMIKSAVFAFLIGIIACHSGMTTEGGATGVGQSTTRSVVAASISIFIGNFFLSKVLLELQSRIGQGF